MVEALPTESAHSDGAPIMVNGELCWREKPALRVREK
jgi:hypothetical protein